MASPKLLLVVDVEVCSFSSACLAWLVVVVCLMDGSLPPPSNHHHAPL